MTMPAPAWSRRALSLVLGCGLLGCATTENSAGDGEEPMRAFISMSETAAPPALAAEPWAVRHVGVEPNPRFFTEDGPAKGDTLVVELFDAEQVVSVVTATDRVLGHLNVRARTVEPHLGVVLLTVGERRMVGSVRLQDRRNHYYLRHDTAAGQHVLIEVDPDAEDVLPEAPPEEVPPREEP